MINDIPSKIQIPPLHKDQTEIQKAMAVIPTIRESRELSCNQLMELALEHNETWKKALISVDDIFLKTIRKNRIYEIRIKSKYVHGGSHCLGGEIDPEMQSDHHEKTLDNNCWNHDRRNRNEMYNGILVNTAMLLKFFNFQTPERMISDNVVFEMNISKQLWKNSLGPGGMSVISATYFGKATEVGYVRDWVHGLPLKNYLQQYSSEHSFEFLQKIFRDIGVKIASFHQLLQNPDFQECIVEHHFAGELGFQPVAPVRFNKWQEEAISLLTMSDMSTSKTWKHFYQKLISDHPRISDICQNIIIGTESSQANALVFGHFDCNVSNIIVSMSTADEVQTCLIDEEWACPNMAVYDFGKLVSSVMIMMKRKETVLKKYELKELVKEISVYYLKGLGTTVGNEEKAKVDFYCIDKLDEDGKGTDEKELCSKFSRDIWRFTAYAALLNSYSNLIHASKEGQLSNIEEDSQIILSSSGDFNWVRHAYDHYLIFEEFMDV